MKPSKDKIDTLHVPSRPKNTEFIIYDTLAKKLNELVEKVNLHEEYFNKDIHIMVEDFNERLAEIETILKLSVKHIDKLESQPEEQCKQCKRFYGSDVSGKQTLTIYACEEHAISKDPSPKKECKHKYKFVEKENYFRCTLCKTLIYAPEEYQAIRKTIYTSEGDAVGEVK